MPSGLSAACLAVRRPVRNYLGVPIHAYRPTVLLEAPGRQLTACSLRSQQPLDPAPNEPLPWSFLDQGRQEDTMIAVAAERLRVALV
jgi:hypothetical protein